MTVCKTYKLRILAFALGVTCAVAGPPRESQADILTASEPFVSPKGSYVTEQGRYHTYRIPGMLVAPDGSVLVFAEGRRGDGSDPRKDDNAPIDMVMRRSTDSGQTWENMVVIDSGFQPDEVLVDFGDPTPVLDTSTGTIFLFYGQWPDFGSTTASVGQDPNSADNNQVVWVRSSSDSGLTWSDRVQILYPDQPNDTPDGLYWRQAEPGPGNGVQLQWQDDNPSFNGRLVIPAKRSGSTTPTGSATVEPFIYYSDDHGATWQIGNVTPGPDANEDEVVELTNGTLLLDARQNSGNFRRRHQSTDGGHTWGPNLADDVAITKVDGSMYRYSAVRDGHDRDRILFSGPRGEGGLNRNNITVWTSYDEGHSFINPVQISSGFAAYSVVQRLADGTIGLIYEPATPTGASYGGIAFRNFDLAHLEGADHPAAMSHYDGFGNQIDAFRGGIGWSGAWDNSGADIQPGGLEFPGFFTEDDDQHIHLRGADITRNLGTGAIDLNQNQDYYISLFVRHNSADGEDSGSEFLDIILQDESGSTQAAFGAGSGEQFFINGLGNTVSTAPDVAERDTTYLLLAKLVAQDNSSGGHSDQLLLAWYDDAEQVPNDESELDWQLVGATTENLNTMINSIHVGAGADSDWLVDALRIGTAFEAVIVDTGVGPPPLLGDLNDDRRIDLADWLVFRANMTLDTGGLSDDERLRVGDFDTNGLVDPRDFIVFVDIYDTHNGAGAFTALLAVPEPDAIVLVLVGLAAIVGRRLRMH